jgi:2-hydroxy-3-oxopropionate reductase
LTLRQIEQEISMTNIAFIGLGIMGNPMAGHLAKGGHSVVGYNRTPKYDDLEAAGGKGAASIKEAVADADVVCVMVPDSPDVQEVLAGQGGVFDTAKPGTLVIDFSSIRPDVTVELANEAKERGFRLIDAPVSGGEKGAHDAVLSIMVGGDAADVQEARPLLDIVGKTVVHVGGNGSGQTVKAANQLIVAANIQALAEAVVFLSAYGVDLDAALEVLGGGLAGSKVLDQKKSNMLTGSFAPGFRIDLHHKDLGIVTSAAREAGVVVPVAALVAQLMTSARANGDGGLDHSALLRGVQRLSGQSAEG